MTKATTTATKSAETADFSGLAGHKCTVQKGCRKFSPGTQLDIVKVGTNRWHNSYAVAVTKSGTKTIDPKWLKIGKALPENIMAEYEAEQEANNQAVILTAEPAQETEKGVALRVEGWAKPRWIGKSMTGYCDNENGTFDVPLWWAKNEFGEAFAKDLPMVE